MANNYLFSFQPTFTQGLVLGQLSILILLGLILKYLFLDSTEYPFETSSYHPRVDSNRALRNKKPVLEELSENTDNPDCESAEWLNVLLLQLVDVYRARLRNYLPGFDGDEIARQRLEDYANKIRPPGFLGHIKVHSVDLGSSVPHLHNGRRVQSESKSLTDIEFDVSYVDSVSVSLSTSYLFNYPMPSFARLPVSLTISLSQFKTSMIITPPSSTSAAPSLTLAISPTFTLDLSTTSLMGSRAKLANVPKLHELIQHQVRRALASRAIWKVELPGLSTAAEIRQEIRKDASAA